MFQIDNSTAASALKTPAAPGAPGFFTPGNPGTGEAATILDADFMNMIMMELNNVVLGAGLTPNKANYTQVLTAIQQIVNTATNNYFVDTGTANAFVIAPSPAITSLTDGQVFRFKALHANTTIATIKINALSPITIVRNDGSDLQAGDIPAAGIATIVYDLANTRFLLQSVNASANQIQAQAGNGADDTGSANAYVCTLTPALAAHAKYVPIRVKIANTNTGASTFNPGPGAVSIVSRDGAALAGGELQAGAVVEFFYDGTNYQYQSSLQPATNAQALAGTDVLRALTPAALFSLFGASLGTSGYQKLPGGFILQWGRYTTAITAEQTVPVTFPTTFNVAAYVAIGIMVNSAAGHGTAADLWCQRVSMTASGAVFITQSIGLSGPFSLQGLDYIVFGK